MISLFDLIPKNKVALKDSRSTGLCQMKFKLPKRKSFTIRKRKRSAVSFLVGGDRTPTASELPANSWGDGIVSL